MLSKRKADCAASPIVAELLIIVLTIVILLLLLVVLMSLIPSFDFNLPKQSDEYFVITSIDLENNIVRVKNSGCDIISDDYSMSFTVNDVFQDSIVIETLNAHKFIPTHHFGVATLSGAGPVGTVWKSGQTGVIDLENGVFHFGDKVKMDVLYRSNGSVYSSTVYYL